MTMRSTDRTYWWAHTATSMPAVSRIAPATVHGAKLVWAEVGPADHDQTFTLVSGFDGGDEGT